MFMYVLIIVGICAISYLGYKNWVGRGCENLLTDIVRTQTITIATQDETLMLMEQGRTEQEENYEMQFLTFEERLVEKDNLIMQRNADIDELEARLEQHDRECLPILNETRWQALSGSVENA